MNKIIHLITLFVIIELIFNIDKINCQSSNKAIIFNNHYYLLISIPSTNGYSISSYDLMLDYISTVGVQLQTNYPAYPVTINTPEELKFIQDNYGSDIAGFGPNSRVYIGGSKVDPNSDLWIYSNGTAEFGMPFYQQSTGRCFSVCPWAPGNPTTANQPYLALKAGSGNQLQFVTSEWFTATQAIPQYVLLEARGRKDPQFVEYPPPTGGKVIVKNFVMNDQNKNWNLANLAITVVPLGQNAYFPTPTIVSSSSVSFNMQPGVESFSLFFSDGNIETPTINYRYQLPYISTVYTKQFTSGSLITLSGKNFGNQTSKISIQYGTSKTACTNPTFITSNTALTCQLGSNVSPSSPLYPISFTLGTGAFTYTSNRIPFYDPSTVKVLKIGDALGSFSTIRNIILTPNNSATIDSFPITQGVITNTQQTTLMNTIYNWGSNSVHQALESNAGQTGIIATSGQLNGQLVMPNYVCSSSQLFCGTNPNIVSTTKSVGYTPTRLVDTTSAQACELSMFGNTPTQESASSNPMFTDIPTTGLAVNITVSNPGFILSKRTFKLSIYQNTEFTSIQYISANTLQVTFPPGAGSNVNFSLYIEDILVYTGKFSYQAPSLTSVSSGSIYGDTVTVNGINFGVDPSLIAGQFSGDARMFTNFKFISNHTKFTCTIPSDVGTKTVSFTIANQGTNSVSYTYQSPLVSSIIQTGNIFQLSGVNLGLSTSLPILTPTATVVNVTGNSTSSTLFVNIPATTKRGTIEINVAGLKTDFNFDPLPYVTSTSPTPSTTAPTDIAINGYYLALTNQQGQSLAVAITVGGSPCQSLNGGNGDGTSIYCIAPANVGNQILMVNINNKKSNSIIAYTAPYINSITQTEGKLQVNASDVGTVASWITVSISSVSFAASNVSNGIVTFNSMPNNLYNSPASVLVNGLQSSNSISFKLTPVVLNVSSAPTTGGLITVTGQFFNNRDASTNQLDLSVQVNGKTCSGVTPNGNTLLTCTVGAGTGGNYTITVTSGGVSSVSPVKYSYQIPNITSMAQTGSLITLYGTNFGTDLSAISSVFSGQSLQPTRFIGSGIIFDIPTDSSNCNIKVNVSGLLSNPFTMKLVPTINKASPAPTPGGKVTITGDFLSGTRCDGSSPTIIVKIDQTFCSDPTSNGTVLFCIAPAGTGSNHLLTVTIDGLTGGSVPFEYLPPFATNFTQQSTMALIEGQNFGDDMFKVSVNFGAFSTGIQSFTGASKFLVNIPPFSLSGQLNVVINGQKSNNITYQLAPVLYSASNAKTDGSRITITGQFLNDIRQDGTPTSISINLATVGDCTNIIKLPNDARSSYLSCDLPAGQGSNLNLSVSIDGLTSYMQFSYTSPEITKVSIDIYNLITVSGKGLGTLDTTIVNMNGRRYKPSQVQSSELIIQAPVEQINGFISITAFGMISNFVWYRLSPVITSVSSPNTAGSNFTIYGANINLYDGLGRLNFYQISYGSQKLVADTVNSNSTALIVTAPPGSGAGHGFTLLIDTLQTTSSFRYLPPMIDNITAIAQTVTALGDNFGSRMDQITPFPDATLISLTQKQAVFSIPSNYRNGPVTFNVNGQSSNSIQLKMEPYLLSTTFVPIQGGVITLSGNYLNGLRSNDTPADVIIKVGHQTCEFLDSNQEGTQMTCQLISDFANLNNVTLSLSIDGIQSPTNLSYTLLPSNLLSCTSLYFNRSGEIIITGDHFPGTNYTVSIQGEICENVTKIDNQTISCIFAANVVMEGSVGLTVNVTNDEVSFANDIYIYLANHCDGICIFGFCNSGYCICNEGFGGQLCNIRINTTLPQPSLINSKTSTNLFEPDVNVTTDIIYIRELDQSGAIVSTIDMSSASWSTLSTQSDDTKSTTNNRAIFSNQQSNLKFDVSTQFYSKNINYTYLSEPLYIPAGSIKQSISISGWSFKNTNNTLQVLYKAVGPDDLEYNCANRSTKIVVGKVHTMIPSFLVDSAVGVLVAQFPVRTKIDLSTGILSIKPIANTDPIYDKNSKNSIVYSIDIPNFTEKAEFDPVFSIYNKPNLTVTDPATCPSTTSSVSTGQISQSFKLLPSIYLLQLLFVFVIIFINF